MNDDAKLSISMRPTQVDSVSQYAADVSYVLQHRSDRADSDTTQLAMTKDAQKVK